MKGEQEIRSHRDDLQKWLRQREPCDCDHCTVVNLGITAEIRALSWALGENPDNDRLVEEVAAYVRRL